MSDDTNKRLCVDCQQPLPDDYEFTRHIDWQDCIDALSARYGPIEAENATLRARVAELEAENRTPQPRLTPLTDEERAAAEERWAATDERLAAILANATEMEFTTLGGRTFTLTLVKTRLDDKED